VKRRRDGATVAIGFRSRTGRAVAVSLSGPVRWPVVVDRRWLEICDPALPRQVYHAAAGLASPEAGAVVRRATAAASEGSPPAGAEALVRRAEAAANALARRGVRSVLRELRAGAFEVVGAGIVLAAGRPPATLEQALASHAALHAAEGEMYRRALVEAVARAGLPVLGVAERDLVDRASKALLLTAAGLPRRLAEIGRPVGPPWGRDEKQAALAAWLALAASRRVRGPRLARARIREGAP
jgi:hypothetical protein